MVTHVQNQVLPLLQENLQNLVLLVGQMSHQMEEEATALLIHKIYLLELDLVKVYLI